MSFLYCIEGNNFSGRSEFLSSLQGANIIHIGSNASNHLSALTTEVSTELFLHNSNSKDKCHHFLKMFDFEKLVQSHPLTLSGGEKILVCLFEHLLLDKEVLCIDNAFEQLSGAWRESFLEFVDKEYPEKKLYISDNRIDEFRAGFQTVAIEGQKKTEYPYLFSPACFSIGIPASESSVHHSFIIEDLSFSYKKGRKLFDQLSVEFSSGIYHINGGNGSGKSTLSKIISGLLKPQGGQLVVDGRKVDSHQYPGSIAGFSFQNPGEQIFEQTVEKQVLGSNPYDEKRMHHILELFGLENLRELHPEDLPFTIKKRIGLACALYRDQPIYIFDEPTQ